MVVAEEVAAVIPLERQAEPAHTVRPSGRETAQPRMVLLSKVQCAETAHAQRAAARMHAHLADAMVVAVCHIEARAVC